MLLKVENIYYEIDGVTILKDVNLAINQGEFVGIIGPNGSGKSTLLKNIYRVLRPTKGAIYLNDKKMSARTNKEVAKELAVVSQEFDYGFDFTVREIVLMGRYPLKEFYEMENKEDEKIVDLALDRVGLKSFKERSFLTLSGGEKQRALIARAIAQETNFIIMDEPTNHLDVGYQMKVMDLIRSLDKTVLTAIHDLNMAIAYCDKIFVIDDGVIVKTGKPADVITETMIQEIYDVPAHIEYNAFLQRNMIIFKSEREVVNTAGK